MLYLKDKHLIQGMLISKYKNNIKMMITYNYAIDNIHVAYVEYIICSLNTRINIIILKTLSRMLYWIYSCLYKQSVSMTADGAHFHIHKIFHQKIKRHCKAINICRNTSQSGRSLCNNVRNIRCHVCTRHLKSYQTLGTAKILFTISLNITDWLFILRVTDKILALKCVLIFQKISCDRWVHCIK